MASNLINFFISRQNLPSSLSVQPDRDNYYAALGDIKMRAYKNQLPICGVVSREPQLSANDEFE
jgi:hypothetical protein